MKISRRDFLQMLGVTGALAGGISHVWAIPDEWREKLRSGPRIESWKFSTCGQCPAGCGIRIRLIDDIPVRILGNPIAPVNRGFICPMGESGLELLYHPDRISQPLRRKGKKGEPGWQPISWDEAIKQVSDTIQDLAKEKQTGGFGFLMGDRNTLLTQLAGLFTARLGSSNFFHWRTPGVNELGFWQACGEFPPFSFDLTRTDYLITFGTNLLEEPPSPVHFNRIYGKLKESRLQSGLKMVHIDARMSQAGKNATEWVQIRPGSMGALALGLAHVIIRDKNYDQDFIRLHTQDFQKGNGDFLDLVTRDYSPERVSGVTGVPPDTIIRLARTFGSAKAPLALSGGTSDASETALFAQWAVASLNALSGSFSAKGLWREPTPLPWGAASVSEFSPRGSSFSFKPKNARDADLPASWVTEQLPTFFPAGKPPELKMLMLAQVNPAYQATNQKMWKDWLGRIPLVVQFATLLDDTSPYADLVLPATTYLEHWDLTLPVPNLPFSQLGLQQPVVPPLKGARSVGDALLQLGKGLGGNPFPDSDAKSYGEYVQARMKPIFTSGEGTPYFEVVSLAFLEELRKRGWQVYSYPAFSDFWRLLQEKGGWWDPGEYPEVDWRRGRTFVFPTVPRLAKLLEERSVLNPGEGTKKRDKPPHLWLEESVKKPEAPDSFILAPFTILMNMNGDGASQSLLRELSGLYPRLYWDTWAEMNPRRAKELKIKNGDLIRVVSKNGSVKLPVVIVPTVSPEILSVPFGQGHTELGRYAKNVGRNPITIIDPRVDPLSGRNSWHSTHVRVEKIGK
jgi:anaerobic selenocysteine-containing dehydrogenase